MASSPSSAQIDAAECSIAPWLFVCDVQLWRHIFAINFMAAIFYFDMQFLFLFFCCCQWQTNSGNTKKKKLKKNIFYTVAAKRRNIWNFKTIFHKQIHKPTYILSPQYKYLSKVFCQTNKQTNRQSTCHKCLRNKLILFYKKFLHHARRRTSAA